MRKNLIKCPKCNGGGWIPMSIELRETLRTVKLLGKATTNDVASRLDPSGAFHITAFNNRLAFLKALGLVKRKRVSRKWVYEPV